MLEAAILCDPVIDMHDEIVGLQLLEIEQRALRGRALASVRARLAENFLFAVDVEAVFLQHDAGRNFALHDRRTEVRPFHQRRKALAFDVDLEVARFQMTAQARRLVRALDDHQRAPLSALDFAQFGRERLEAGRRPHTAQLIRAEPQRVAEI